MMIKCRVQEELAGCYLIEFEDGKTLFLQDDVDVICFGVASGLIPAPIDWNKNIDDIKVDYSDYDLEEIEECPDDYYSIAE